MTTQQHRFCESESESTTAHDVPTVDQCESSTEQLRGAPNTSNSAQPTKRNSRVTIDHDRTRLPAVPRLELGAGGPTVSATLRGTEQRFEWPTSP